MLKRINRIFSRKEFERIKTEGALWRGRLVSGLVLMNTEGEGKRFGVIISKKISKRAVDRNKIRRLVYSSVEEDLEKFNNGTRIIFLVRPGIAGKKYEEVRVEVSDLVQKILIKRL